MKIHCKPRYFGRNTSDDLLGVVKDDRHAGRQPMGEELYGLTVYQTLHQKRTHVTRIAVQMNDRRSRGVLGGLLLLPAGSRCLRVLSVAAGKKPKVA